MKKIAKKLNKKQKVIFSLATFALVVLVGVAFSIFPKKVSAIGLCSSASAPSITISINGQTFTTSGSITVPVGSVLPFTVWTVASPSSPNSITYPGGSNMYPGPCGTIGACSAGRSYTTSAITAGTSYINVDITENCQQDGTMPPSTSLSIAINTPAAPTCAITSFTCDPNSLNTLTWVTTNCSVNGASLSVQKNGPAILTGQPSNGNMTHASFLPTAYYLTVDGVAYPFPRDCGAAPTLSAIWSESGSATLSKTVSPGVQPPYGFKYWKVGSAPVKFSSCVVRDYNARVIGNCNPYKAVGDPITGTP